MTATINVPVKVGIQRGDPWEFILRGKNATVIDSTDFAAQLRHEQDVLDAIPDLTHREDVDDPYVLFVVDETVTAAILHNLLSGEIQVGGRTWVSFVVPVTGQSMEVTSA